MENAHEVKSQMVRKLMELKEVVMQFDDNIQELHSYVKNIMIHLEACGETSIDIRYYLFEAYNVVKSKSFQQYLVNLKVLWNMKKIELNCDGNNLMDLTEGYYKRAIDFDIWTNEK